MEQVREQFYEEWRRKRWKKTFAYGGDVKKQRIYFGHEELGELLSSLGIRLSSKTHNRVWKELREVTKEGKPSVALDRLEKELLGGSSAHIEKGRTSEDQSLGNYFREHVLQACSGGRKGLNLVSFFRMHLANEPDVDTFCFEDFLSCLEDCIPTFLQRYNHFLLVRNAKQLFRSMDKRKRNLVTYDEFATWVLCDPAKKSHQLKSPDQKQNQHVDDGVSSCASHDELLWKRFEKCSKADKEAAVQGILLFITRIAFTNDRAARRSKWYDKVPERIPVALARAELIRRGIDIPAPWQILLWKLFDLDEENTLSKKKWNQLVLAITSESQLFRSQRQSKPFLQEYHGTSLWSLARPDHVEEGSERESSEDEDGIDSDEIAQDSPPQERAEHRQESRTRKWVIRNNAQDHNEVSSPSSSEEDDKEADSSDEGSAEDMDDYLQIDGKYVKNMTVAGKNVLVDPEMRAYKQTKSGTLRFLGRVVRTYVVETLDQQATFTMDIDYHAREYNTDSDSSSEENDESEPEQDKQPIIPRIRSLRSSEKAFTVDLIPIDLCLPKSFTSRHFITFKLFPWTHIESTIYNWAACGDSTKVARGKQACARLKVPVNAPIPLDVCELRRQCHDDSISNEMRVELNRPHILVQIFKMPTTRFGRARRDHQFRIPLQKIRTALHESNGSCNSLETSACKTMLIHIQLFAKLV